jgi:hypothetical protein
MSLRDFVARQAARATYLVERGLLAVEEAAREGGVLPRRPPPNAKDREQKNAARDEGRNE